MEQIELSPETLQQKVDAANDTLQKHQTIQTFAIC